MGKDTNIEKEKHVYGNEIIGMWICPRCRYRIIPDKLEKAKNSFIWSNKSKSLLKGFIGPHCKKCSTPMELVHLF